MVKANAIYQTGTITSLIQGVYDGDKTINELMRHGNFGLGTYDSADGEMIIFDKVCYKATSDGKLSVAKDSEGCPFAVITNFVPEKNIKVTNVDSKQLEELLIKQFPSHNTMYAICVYAKFKHIHIRTVSCQMKPYHKLNEVLSTSQTHFEYDNVEGVLIGLWFPEYMANLNVPGFHFHFVDNERKVGGHVYDYQISEAQVAIQENWHFDMELIKSKAFDDADLSGDHHDAIASVEKARD